MCMWSYGLLFKFKPYYLTLGFVPKRLSLKPLQVQINTMIGKQTGRNSEKSFAPKICPTVLCYCIESAWEHTMAHTVCTIRVI